MELYGIRPLNTIVFATLDGVDGWAVVMLSVRKCLILVYCLDIVLITIV